MNGRDALIIADGMESEAREMMEGRALKILEILPSPLRFLDVVTHNYMAKKDLTEKLAKERD